ncbi:hypothetical protein [Nocardioides sp. SYSU D00038]|uniref:hypothetical protein n=1 Tax=Nocardioides sp. SYSU D00038 TaxID=2812554 RepID=UPI001967E7A2|nr:hypothetical protein [Nocardioides sp. SYSU D00038]
MTIHPARRGRSLAAALALVAVPLAGLSAVGLPAEAAPGVAARQAAPVSDAELELEAAVYRDQDDCSLTGDDPLDSAVSLPANGKPLSRSAASTSTITNDSVPADKSTVRLGVSGQASVRVAGGQLAELAMRASGRAVAEKTDGTACDAGGYTGINARFEFVLVRPSWVQVSMAGTSETNAYVEGGAPGDSFGVGGSGGGERTLRRYLPAGTYQVFAGIGWSTGGPFAIRSARGNARKAVTESAAGSGSIRLRVLGAGAATGAATGSGKRFVRLADAGTCATGRLGATFTRRAGQVVKATFRVNGKVRKTVRDPRRGRTVLVPGLPATRPTTVKVEVVVDPPGRRSRVTKTVRRSYEPCRPA